MDRRYPLKYKRDLPDQRDLFLKVPWYRKLKLTESDLRTKKITTFSVLSPISDQNDLGSCTAHAVGDGCFEYIWRLQQLPIYGDTKDTNFSRLFLYYWTRYLEHTVNVDSGASLRDTCKALAKYGICHENLYPYDETKFTNKPSITAITDGNKHKPATYYKITSLNDMSACLSQGYPFACGIVAYDQIFDVDKNHPFIELPGKKDAPAGGHAICIIGLTQINSKWFFIMRNSWGTDWGMNGYAYISTDYLSNWNLSVDFWTLRGPCTGPV